MNNEQKQYILRKPVTILHELDYSLELNLGEYMMPVDKDCFKDEFVPLDVSGLTRQVEKQIHKAFIRGYEYGLKTDGEPSEDPTFDYEKLKTTIAEQIVLLLLNQEGETKK